MTVPAILDFEGVQVRILDRSGKPWVTQEDLAKALYGIKGGGQDGLPLEGAERQLRRLFARNRDEFTDDMTAILLMETAGGPQQVRIYSARGCHLMGMFSKTALARQFRQWVLDVLEGKGTGTSAGTLGANPEEGGGPLRLDMSKDNLSALRARTAAMNAVSRSLEMICRSAGRRPAAQAASDLYRTIGIHVDLTHSETLAQGELDIKPDDPPAN